MSHYQHSGELDTHWPWRCPSSPSVWGQEVSSTFARLLWLWVFLNSEPVTKSQKLLHSHVCFQGWGHPYSWSALGLGIFPYNFHRMAGGLAWWSSAGPGCTLQSELVTLALWGFYLPAPAGFSESHSASCPTIERTQGHCMWVVGTAPSEVPVSSLTELQEA
jgi:hypothetical protein